MFTMAAPPSWGGCIVCWQIAQNRCVENRRLVAENTALGARSLGAIVAASVGAIACWRRWAVDKTHDGCAAMVKLSLSYVMCVTTCTTCHCTTVSSLNSSYNLNSSRLLHILYNNFTDLGNMQGGSPVAALKFVRT